MVTIPIEKESARQREIGAAVALPPIPWVARYRRIFWGSLGIIGVLLCWQIGATVGVLDPLFVSTPVAIFFTALQLVPSSEFALHFVSTTEVLFLGLAIALMAGVVLGLPTGWFPTLHALLEPIIAAVYAVPYIAFLPMIIMWTGIGATSRIIIVIWSAVFPLLINSIQGAREVNSDYLRVGRSFSASNLQLFFTIALPASTPYILAGLRTSIGRAVLGAVVAEFFMSSQGLGYFINLKANSLEMAPAFVAIIVLALFGIVLVSLVTYVENRFCNWS